MSAYVTIGSWTLGFFCHNSVNMCAIWLWDHWAAQKDGSALLRSALSNRILIKVYDSNLWKTSFC